MTEQRHEFGSPTWVDYVRTVITTRLADVDLRGPVLSFSEEFTDPPTHLLTEGRTTIGWHFRIDNGVLHVDDEPLAGADRRIVADYATILPIAHLSNSDPAIGPLREARGARGQLRYEGDDVRGDPRGLAALDGLHDELVKIIA